MLSRRTMLIVTGGAGAAGLVGGGTAGAAARVTSTGEAPLTAQEFRLIAAMTEGIIPKPHQVAKRGLPCLGWRPRASRSRWSRYAGAGLI